MSVCLAQINQHNHAEISSLGSLETCQSVIYSQVSFQTIQLHKVSWFFNHCLPSLEDQVLQYMPMHVIDVWIIDFRESKPRAGLAPNWYPSHHSSMDWTLSGRVCLHFPWGSVMQWDVTSCAVLGGVSIRGRSSCSELANRTMSMLECMALCSL